MRILHCCLSAFYIDNYGYQENILPRMHKLQGHEVMILASTETFIDKVNLGYLEPSEYVNEDGIPVHRIPYVSWLPKKLARKMRYYKNVYKELDRFNPNFIFIHNAQFMSITEIVEWIKKHPNVKVNVDGHSDYSNSARTFWSKWLLHKTFYKHCVKSIEPYARHFFGVLPARVDFFKEVYNTPAAKTKLLVMGADDKYVENAKVTNQRNIIRSKFNINDKTFLIVSGGKFDSVKKQILDLMDAVKELSTSRDIKLLIFGSVMEDNGFKDSFMSRCDGEIVKYAGWIKGSESYNYFEASDLVVFPGRHSVLWEQAVGQGKPCVFKYYPGHTHVDLDGNCLFVKEANIEELKNSIMESMKNYNELLACAQTKGIKFFSYFDIAKRALE